MKVNELSKYGNLPEQCGPGRIFNYLSIGVKKALIFWEIGSHIFRLVFLNNPLQTAQGLSFQAVCFCFRGLKKVA